MTSRELIQSAIQGKRESSDRRPIIAWPDVLATSDVLISDAPLDSDESKPRLVEVLNPFGRALKSGTDLNRLLDSDPVAGAETLDQLVDETRLAMESALRIGADGVFYRLHGAAPEHCTPMQYGGHYLERDRELLEAFTGAPLNILFVVGGEGVYVDFVSDLPASLFGWDLKASGLSSAYVRSMRTGAQLSADPESEVELAHSTLDIARTLENQLLTTH